jgi:N-acylneuraminate cytidylyltransferase
MYPDKVLSAKRIVAFIPARGGSKGIKDKNIMGLNGKPLVYWTARAASECPYISQVYVATDSERIASVVENFNLPKCTAIGRDPETATDTATTESAMLDFAGRIDFDYIVLMQATSPLTTGEELTRGIEKYFADGADSLISAILQTSFLWINEKPFIHPMNYDPLRRPRRQDYNGCLVENGAFYITRKDLLLKTGCRVSGNISAYIMPPEAYFEIDDLADFPVLETLMNKRNMDMSC